MDPSQRLDRLKRKLVEEVVIEKITPMKRDMNVDLKQLRKYIEECMANIHDHTMKHKSTQG